MVFLDLGRNVTSVSCLIFYCTVCTFHALIYMSALLFLHSIHVGVPGPTAHSHYLELLIYKVFHTAGPIPAGCVLVAELSVFTYRETGPLATLSSGLVSPRKDNQPIHTNSELKPPPCRSVVRIQEPSATASGQASLRVWKRWQPPPLQARSPSRFPAPKPRRLEQRFFVIIFFSARTEPKNVS